jgi:hypothetical protein
MDSDSESSERVSGANSKAVEASVASDSEGCGDAAREAHVINVAVDMTAWAAASRVPECPAETCSYVRVEDACCVCVGASFACPTRPAEDESA